MKSMMRKLALVSMLVSATTYGAVTGTLTLSGSISAVISIVVNPLAAASTLNLTANQTDLAVATVDENSNAVNGYKITASSANNGQIKHATLADNVGYTMKYDGGSAVTLTTSAQDVKTVGSGGVYADTSNVSISYTGSSSLTAGAYSDVITFTIVAL